MSVWPPRVPTLAKGPHLSGYSKGEHLVLGKSIAHDMKSGAEGAHFFGALLLTFSFDKHTPADGFLFYFLLKRVKLRGRKEFTESYIKTVADYLDGQQLETAKHRGFDVYNLALERDKVRF